MKQLTIVMILVMSGSAMAAEPPGSPATMPDLTAPGGTMPGGMPLMGEVGSIAIKAVQGTKGGPKVAYDEVTVELYGHGGKMRTIETKLDAHGVVTIENLPLVPPFRPRVFIKHAGTSYTQDGGVIDAGHPTQDISVTVYETSDSDPKWEVAMWHLIVQPAEQGGLEVLETLAVRNPADTAYLGAADAEGRRTSVALSLPKGVEKIEQMSGALHSCCASIVAGRLLSKAPITPGTSQLKMGYVIPTPAGKVDVALVAPAPAKQLLIFVPKDMKGFSSDTLKPGDVFTVHDRPMQSYILSDISAGQEMSFVIEGIPRPVAKASNIPKVLAGLGSVILVISCIVVLLIRRPESEPETA
ncbi:MAG: hypothetical protein QGG42_09030 [Phycisphaerae bacterium]|jgi:hypothetical protein|nr:hypothetical protein [Phycisphaerae bacterium]